MSTRVAAVAALILWSTVSVSAPAAPFVLDIVKGMA